MLNMTFDQMTCFPRGKEALIIVPAYNEAEGIVRVVNEIERERRMRTCSS